RRRLPSVAAVTACAAAARSVRYTSGCALPPASAANIRRNGSAPTKTTAVLTTDALLESVSRYLKRVTPLNPDGRFAMRTVPSALTVAVPTSGGSSIVTVSGSPSGSLSFARTLMLSSAAPSARNTSCAATGGWLGRTVIATVPSVVLPELSLTLTRNESD